MLRKFLSYFTFKKQQKGYKKNIILTLMHGINRISIFMFLIAVIIMIVKFVIMK